MLKGQVFLGNVAVSQEEESGNHQLVVSWKLSHPACIERLCIQFSPGRISDYCVDDKLSTKARIKGLPCNKNVNVHVRASAAGISRTVYGGRIRIGGKITALLQSQYVLLVRTL